jgi:hypothetical protein
MHVTTEQRAFWKRPAVIVTAIVVAAFVAVPLLVLIADAIWGSISTVIYN